MRNHEGEKMQAEIEQMQAEIAYLMRATTALAKRISQMGSVAVTRGEMVDAIRQASRQADTFVAKNLATADCEVTGE
jgi:hypothetical protein